MQNRPILRTWVHALVSIWLLLCLTAGARAQNNLTNNGATFAAGKFNNGATFTDNATIVIPAPVANPANWKTLEFWVKIPAGGYASGVLSTLCNFIPANDTSKTIYFAVANDGSNRPYLQLNSTEGVFGTALTLGAWNHVAITFNGTTASIYENGSLAGSRTFTAFIGGAWSGTLSYATPYSLIGGTLDEVRFSTTLRYTGAYTVPTAAFTDDTSTTALYHLEDLTDSHSASAPANTPTIYADNTNFTYIGLNVLSGTGATSKATFVNNGSGVDFVFGGTFCNLCFDVSAFSGNYPDVQIEADGLGVQRATLDSSGVVAVTLNASQSIHSVRAVWNIYEGTGTTPDLYGSATGALLFKGVGINTSLYPSGVPPNFIEYLGDSRTATFFALGTSGLPATYDVAHGWPQLVARRLGLRPVVNAHSGQGIVQNNGGGNAQGSFPLAGTGFGKVYAGQTYTLSPAVVVIALGTNDRAQGVSSSAFQTGYTSYLATVRAARPNAIIFCVIMPGDGVYSAAIPASITAAGDSKAYTLDYSALSITSTDGVHFDLSEQYAFAAKISGDIQSRLTALGIKVQTATTTTTTISNQFSPRRSR